MNTMKYIAFFRGINVGGRNKVAMSDLRKLLSELGLLSVRTYIQSGNALFESGEDERALAHRIERGFLEAFGFESIVMLRTGQELAAILDNLPFSEREIAEAGADANGAECLYCYLLFNEVPESELQALCAAYSGKDRLVAVGREIYLLCHQSIRDSKLAASLAKLQLPMTSRNLKTLRKLFELAGEGGD